MGASNPDSVLPLHPSSKEDGAEDAQKQIAHKQAQKKWFGTIYKLLPALPKCAQATLLKSTSQFWGQVQQVDAAYPHLSIHKGLSEAFGYQVEEHFNVVHGRILCRKLIFNPMKDVYSPDI